MIEVTDNDIRWAEDVAEATCGRKGLEVTPERKQAARIALLEAAERFTGRRGATFQTYAYKAVTRRLLRPPAREAPAAERSLDGPNGDGLTLLGDTIRARGEDASEIASAREMYARLEARCGTDRERRILSLLAEGQTTREVADALRLSPRWTQRLIRRLRARLSA